MAEYMVEYKDDGLYRKCAKERIVRCRDCGRAYRRGGGVYCSRVLQWGSNDRPAPLPVDPDGFCAWGEPREVSE